MRNLRNLFIMLFTLSSLASATVVTYTSRPLWAAASSGITNVNFDSLTLGAGNFTDYGSSTGLMHGGLTFVGTLAPSTYWLYALNPSLISGIGPQDYGTGTLIKASWGSTSYLAVTLPASMTSFGLDLMTAYPDAQSFRIELDNVQVAIVITSAHPTPTFFGVTSDAPISQVKIYFEPGGNGATVGLFDNFAYGSIGTPPGGGETPEVATMLSVGSGLVLLRWVKRRQLASPPVAA